MFERLGSHLRHQWMGALALFVALGGTAYAVTELQRNSVKSKHILNGQVRSVDIEDDGVTGDDVAEASLGSVPSAQQANDAQTLDGADSTDFAQAGSEEWQPLALNAPGFSCGWVGAPAFFRDPAGIVHLKGTVTAVDGTGNACDGGFAIHRRPNAFGAFPPGYRPAHSEAFPVVSNNTLGVITMFENAEGFYISNGFPTFANAKQWVSLSGISWRCGPSGENGCP